MQFKGYYRTPVMCPCADNDPARHCQTTACPLPRRAVDAGARAGLARRLTAFEWTHEPALQAALAAAGGLPAAPEEVRPEGGVGWALRSRRGHLLQARCFAGRHILNCCSFAAVRWSA